MLVGQATPLVDDHSRDPVVATMAADDRHVRRIGQVTRNAPDVDGGFVADERPDPGPEHSGVKSVLAVPWRTYEPVEARLHPLPPGGGQLVPHLRGPEAPQVDLMDMSALALGDAPHLVRCHPSVSS